MNTVAVVGGNIALLRRRDKMAQELFRRYWRDVHGTLATRIPGMYDYVQHHLDPHPIAVTGDAQWAAELDGVAEVRRTGAENLPDEVTDLIREDERTVFSLAVNFRVDRGRVAGWDLTSAGVGLYLIERHARDHTAAASLDDLLPTLEGLEGVSVATRCDLTLADASWWDTPGVSNVTSSGSTAARTVRLNAVDHSRAADAIRVLRAAEVPATVSIACHAIANSYVLVQEGHITTIGLRGLSVAETIREAGADLHDSDRLKAQLFRFGQRRPEQPHQAEAGPATGWTEAVRTSSAGALELPAVAVPVSTGMTGEALQSLGAVHDHATRRGSRLRSS